MVFCSPVTSLDILVISPSLDVMDVCKPLMAVAMVDDELYPVSVFSNSVMSAECVVIVPSAAVTLVVKPPIAEAFAAKPVVPLVMDEFKLVMFTLVDISILSLTPATSNRSLALWDIELPLAVICV